MGELYNCISDNVGLHLKNIYKDLELDSKLTTEEFSLVQKKGNREVKRNVKYYNLDAVISVVVVAKNYLSKEELEDLDSICFIYYISMVWHRG